MESSCKSKSLAVWSVCMCLWVCVSPYMYLPVPGNESMRTNNPVIHFILSLSLHFVQTSERFWTCMLPGPYFMGLHLTPRHECVISEWGPPALSSAYSQLSSGLHGPSSASLNYTKCLSDPMLHHMHDFFYKGDCVQKKKQDTCTVLHAMLPQCEGKLKTQSKTDNQAKSCMLEVAPNWTSHDLFECWVYG